MRRTLAPLALLLLPALGCVTRGSEPAPGEVPDAYRDAPPAYTFDLPLANGGAPVRIGIAPTALLREDGAYWVEASLAADDAGRVRALEFELVEPRGSERVTVLGASRSGAPAERLRVFGRSESVTGVPETTLRVHVETTRGHGEGRFQVGTLP